MSQHAITLDRQTMEGKSVFDLLVGMKYINEDKPNVVDIDERTAFGRKVLGFLYDVGAIKSPYNPKYVSKVKQAELQLERGEYVEVKDVDKFIDEL